MIFTKIWERYIFFSAVKHLLFFLFAIYSIYIITDLSLHGSRFLQSNYIHFIDVYNYYFHHFIKRINLFFPLVLILSMIKVLSTMNLHRELVAFQMGGLSNSQIVRPFIILGAIFSIMILLSYEYIIPNSLNYIDTFKEKKFNISAEKKPFHINHILLSDGSKLIYKSHKPEQQFFDVYWIISLDDIWHIKQLDKSINPPKGHYVDHFLRNEKNELIKKNSYKDYSFPQLNKKNTVKKQALPSCENSAISSLFKRKNIFSTQKEKAEILTYFYYKIIISFTPLLVVISLAPFCMHFSRKISFFLISLISLFLFIFYYSFMNGMIILSENQVIFPSTLLLPFLLPIGYFSIKFFK